VEDGRLMTPKERRKALLLWMENFSVSNTSTLKIMVSATVTPYGKRIYHYTDRIKLVRSDLTQLEEKGNVKRSQYLNGPIYWSVIK
jgi:hypothetical protein